METTPEAFAFVESDNFPTPRFMSTSATSNILCPGRTEETQTVPCNSRSISQGREDSVRQGELPFDCGHHHDQSAWAHAWTYSLPRTELRPHASCLGGHHSFER